MTNSFSLDQAQFALVWGAGHGIGLALVEKLLQNYPRLKVFATYRTEGLAENLFTLANNYSSQLEVYQVDPCHESQVESLALNLKGITNNLDLIINCIGLLHDQSIRPEKSLKSLSPDHFLTSFKVNTLVTALIAKFFEPFISKQSPSIFSSISAKVGSIEDNRVGGWYSYRTSKAALNMFLKTLSIEFKRKYKNCVILAIHPGTTDTALSKPYLNNTPYQVHSAQETAINILNLIEGKSIKETGKFFSWTGDELDW